MAVQEEPGGWPPLLLIPTSAMGSPKDACTSLASFLQSSLSGTVNSLVHHSRVSHLSAFRGTYRLNSLRRGLQRCLLVFIFRSLWQPSQEGGHCQLQFQWLLQVRAFGHWTLLTSSVLGSVGSWGRFILNQTWQFLLFCPSLLCHQQSLLSDLDLDCEWFRVQLSLSISSSRVAHCSQCFLMDLAYCG